MTIHDNYKKMQYKDPSALKNKHKNGDILIIGTGMSTNGFKKYKEKINDKFDAVIGVNFCILNFEDVLTYHIIIEKNSVALYNYMKKNIQICRKNVPRIINYKGIHRYPKELNLMKTTRTNFNGKINIRNYVNNDCNGFLSGPLNKQNLSVGSVALQAIHFAAILGALNVYLIGVDLVLDKKFDHYYQDRRYRNNTKKGPADSPIIKIKHNNVNRETLEYFRDSADYINFVIENLCRPFGIEVYNFSNDSLVSAAKKLNAGEFFKTL